MKALTKSVSFRMARIIASGTDNVIMPEDDGWVVYRVPSLEESERAVHPARRAPEGRPQARFREWGFGPREASNG